MLALAGAASLAPILAVLALQVASAAPREPATPLGPILRLHDLQIGYEGALECAPLERAGEKASELTRFIADFKPQGCIVGYLRLFAVRSGSGEPDPPIVGSVALDARSGAEADAALAVLPLLLRRINDDEAATEVAATTAIGDSTRLFHLDHLETEAPRASSASALVWRSGNVLSGVLVAGASASANDRIAAIYAGRQQARIQTRTPYTAAERDDTEVALDDPRLPVSVQWLGHRFEPGAGLRASRLLYAYRKDERGADPDLSLAYGGALFLDSWTRGAWQRHRRSAVGRLVRNWNCTDSTTVPLAGGHATVYAGYRKNFATCPRRQPSVFFADAYFGDTVVAVNSPACVRCAVTTGGPFNSLRAIKAIVHGLRVRTPATPR